MRKLWLFFVFIYLVKFTREHLQQFTNHKSVMIFTDCLIYSAYFIPSGKNKQKKHKLQLTKEIVWGKPNEKKTSVCSSVVKISDRLCFRHSVLKCCLLQEPAVVEWRQKHDGVCRQLFRWHKEWQMLSASICIGADKCTDTQLHTRAPLSRMLIAHQMMRRRTMAAEADEKHICAPQSSTTIRLIQWWGSKLQRGTFGL